MRHNPVFRIIIVSIVSIAISLSNISPLFALSDSERASQYESIILREELANCLYKSGKEFENKRLEITSEDKAISELKPDNFTWNRGNDCDGKINRLVGKLLGQDENIKGSAVADFFVKIGYAQGPGRRFTRSISELDVQKKFIAAYPYDKSTLNTYDMKRGALVSEWGHRCSWLKQGKKVSDIGTGDYEELEVAKKSGILGDISYIIVKNISNNQQVEYIYSGEYKQGKTSTTTSSSTTEFSQAAVCKTDYFDELAKLDATLIKEAKAKAAAEAENKKKTEVTNKLKDVLCSKDTFYLGSVFLEADYNACVSGIYTNWKTCSAKVSATSGDDGTLIPGVMVNPKPAAIKSCLDKKYGLVISQGLIEGIVSGLDAITEETPNVEDTASSGEAEGDGDPNATSCAIDGVGWIICPTMLFMANMLGGAFNYISDTFLQLEPAMVEEARSTWQVFLNIANVVLIVIFLIIIFSQISGIGVSNYGIKKLLPKIFIVAILMNLSFLMCQLLVDASNVVGRVIYDTMAVDILSATAGEAAASNGSTISSSIDAGQMTALVLAGGAGGAAAIYFLLPVLGATLLAGVVSIITVVFILVARKALIVLLIVVAPLAFAAMLLPNTEKLFDKWKNLMMSLLLLFPIIGLIFGASTLAAGIVQVSGQDILNQIVSLMIMTIPLFAVIPVLKGSLNGLGQIGAKINGMSGKLQASAQKRGEESRLGQYGKHLASRRAKDKALVQAGSYKGRKINFIRRGMSGINSKINQNRAFNRATGNFGLRSAAAGISGVTSEDNKQVEDQMLLINSGVDEREKIDNAAKVLTEANSSGDVIRARAAQKILLSSGALGIQKVHDTIHQLETSKSLNQNVSSALRSDIASSGLKGKDNALTSWAYAVDSSGNAITMRQSEQSASTYSGLNAVEMAGQNIEDLREGANVRGITAAHAQAVLSNDDAQAILGQEKRDFFASIANGQPAPDQRKARKRDSKTTTTAPQAPRRAAPPN